MKKLIILVTLLIVALPTACSRKPKRIAIGVALTASYHPAVKLANKRDQRARWHWRRPSRVKRDGLDCHKSV